MKRRALALLLILATFLCLTAPALAADDLIRVEVTVDGKEVAFHALVYGGTSYVPFYSTVYALRPDAAITYEDGRYFARAEDFTLSVKQGEAYLVINDRYLYLPDGAKAQEGGGSPMLSVRVLCRALGAEVAWTGRMELTTGGSPLYGEDAPYDAETLDLLSRVITHEAGNQSLKGKIAVGNVILNRVESSLFPNTVSGVLFQKGQFTGATNATANAESIVAAKLVLEGANVVPGAFYFNRTGLSSWAARNKKLLYTIGDHAFYG